MCGRFASQRLPDLLARTLPVLGDIPNPPPPWNVAPMQAAAVVRRPSNPNLRKPALPCHRLHGCDGMRQSQVCARGVGAAFG